MWPQFKEIGKLRSCWNKYSCNQLCTAIMYDFSWKAINFLFVLFCFVHQRILICISKEHQFKNDMYQVCKNTVAIQFHFLIFASWKFCILDSVWHHCCHPYHWCMSFMWAASSEKGPYDIFCPIFSFKLFCPLHSPNNMMEVMKVRK